MTRRFPALASRTGVALVIAAFLLQIAGGECAASALGADSAARPPVVVELFTSQGCSSCPPADRLLSRLVDEDRAIALAFHVDYWNYIGWTDPFSSAAWSRRQRDYAAALEGGRVYTPQLVVNGRWQGVGSDPVEVARLLRQAAGSLRDELRLTVEDDGDRLTVRLAAIAAGGRPHPRSGWLAVTESGFETPVGSGENARQTLTNDHVVRRLDPVELKSRGTALEGSIDLELEGRWNRDHLRLVAFLQHPETLAITGAAQTTLP